jgi:uncharacterized protein YdaL
MSHKKMIFLLSVLSFIGVLLNESIKKTRPAQAQSRTNKCVRIYYDSRPGAHPEYTIGKIHSIALQNLLGHFPHIQQYVLPIESYQSGDIEKCEASIYLGTYFEDYQKTSKNVAWLGYNVWKLGAAFLKERWQVRYKELAKLDFKKRDPEGRPGFYKQFQYKGEIFEKFGEWDKDEKERFNADYEISQFEVMNRETNSNVVAWAIHNTNAEAPKLPYILRNQNHWYIGDSPFSFIQESDRYLIFCDVLFDILGEKPRNQAVKKRALFRLEDVHPNLPLWELYQLTNLFYEMKVPFTMSVIPIYRDIYGVHSEKKRDQFVPMSKNASFMDFLIYAQEHGASIIYHGVTHQSKRRNPFNGVTGDDFEFWDRVKNQPIEGDSPEFVISRLEDGLSLFKEAGITPIAWLPPHYQASALDYNLFGQLFTWNVGRVVYYPQKRSAMRTLPTQLKMDKVGAAGNGKRLSHLGDMQFEYDKEGVAMGQFFPYEIYGDVYGQRLIPENVGNLQPYLNEQVHKTQTVAQMIRTMERNRVLNNDIWASYFVHPFYVETTREGGSGAFPGDVKAFVRLINETRKMGYEFVNLKEWIQQNELTLRSDSIEQ